MSTPQLVPINSVLALQRALLARIVEWLDNLPAVAERLAESREGDEADRAYQAEVSAFFDRLFADHERAMQSLLVEGAA